MASITWTGKAGDNNWNNAANWSPAQVPSSADTVTISAAAATAISLSGSDAAGALSTSKLVTLHVADGGSFTLGTASAASTFSNDGTFTLNSTGDATRLDVGAKTLTLNGDGTLVLGNSVQNIIVGAGATSVLDNSNNLIEGAGQLGDGTLTFVNAAAGVVNADDAVALVLNTGTTTTTNAGLLEATGAGGLDIDSNIKNATTGRILAAGGNVYLQGATITGGTISSSGGGAFIESGGGTLGSLTNSGTIIAANYTVLNVLGSIDNTGTILLQAGGGYETRLVAGPSGTAGTATLSGAGAVTLSDNAANYIDGAIAGDTLVSSNLISGAGQIGNGTAFTLVNDGTINADDSVALTVNAGVTLSNAGLVEATGAGGLLADGTINNGAKGTISAAGGTVTLNGATLAGGVLDASSGGVFADEYAATLDGTAHTLTNNADVIAEEDTFLTLLGSIDNAGTVSLQAGGGYGVDFTIGSASAVSTVTLSGGGHITLTDNDGNEIAGGKAGDTLVNENNTISGAGVIGAQGGLVIVNDGIIDATGQNILTLQSTQAALTNNKLLEATGTGGLLLIGTFDNAGKGTISAAGGTVTLNGADIQGGELVATGKGDIIDESSATLDGTANQVVNHTDIIAAEDTFLTLLGTIDNASTISLQAGNGYGVFVGVGSTSAVSTVTLTGGGHITMTNGDNNIGGENDGDTLINVNNVISGAGTIGVGGGLIVVNDALIDASGTTSLTVAGVYAPLTNNGTIEATGTGGLVLNGTIDNGATGIISAAGGTVTLDNVTIEGGVLNATGTGDFIDNSTAVLDGTANALTNDTTIVVQESYYLFLDGTIDNAGTIALQAGNGYGVFVGVGSSSAASTVTLTGGGHITMTNGANNISGAVGDTLVNVNNVISGAGYLGAYGGLAVINDALIDASGSVSLTVGNTNVALTNHGTIEATGSGGLILIGTIDNAGGTLAAAGGIVTLNNADIVGGTLDVTGTGSFTAGGGATLDGSASAVTNAGTFMLGEDYSATVLGTIDNTGTISLVSASIFDTDLLIGTDSASTGVTLTGGGDIQMGGTGNNLFAFQDTGDTLVNLNNTISGAGTLGVGVGGSFTIINDGTIDATGAHALVVQTNNALVNNGVLEATGGGTLALDCSVTGTGTLDIGSTGTLSLSGSFSENADFLGSTGVLDLTVPLDFASLITGFAGGDVIDLINTAETSWSFGSGVLTIKDGTNVVAGLHFGSDYTKADFAVGSDHNGGTSITFV